MKRRHFLHAATASVLLPSALTPGPAVFAGIARKWDYVFFDERFAAAQRAAASWPASNRRIAVRGDVTPFWIGGLDRLTRHDPLHLRGVTTDSFQFCLRILLTEYAHLDVQVTRLDTNLFSWIMRTTPKILTTDHAHG
jgi:hypothetical protein